MAEYVPPELVTWACERGCTKRLRTHVNHVLVPCNNCGADLVMIISVGVRRVQVSEIKTLEFPSVIRSIRSKR